MKIHPDQYRERLAWPLKKKVAWALRQIRVWYDYWDGLVYVSFSGGKDSTVLLHLVRSLYPDVPAVFCNTRMEFPEIIKFVLATPNLTILRPAKTPRQVIRDHGWPVISKDQAVAINRYRHTKDPQQRRYRLHGFPNGQKGMIAKKWRFMIRAPFEVSDECCRVMKKTPFKKYVKETGRRPIQGTMATDSRMRETFYLKYGCNAFDTNDPASRPLSVWTERDVWEFIRAEDIPYCSIYDMGYERTGCTFCGFGVHMERPPNRFQRMKRTHPRLWRYCMDELGMREIMRFMDVLIEQSALGESPFARMRGRMRKKGAML